MDEGEEELSHADRIYRHINDRDGVVRLAVIEEPSQDWASVLSVVEEALANERALSAKIGDIADLALRGRDHATHALMQWFVLEQVEEESVIRDIVSDLKRVAGSKDGLFLIDRELARRQPQVEA